MDDTRLFIISHIGYIPAKKNVSVKILIHLQSSDVYCDESIRNTISCASLPEKNNFFSYTSDIHSIRLLPFIHWTRNVKWGVGGVVILISIS